MGVHKTSTKILPKGFQQLSAPTTTTCTVADTYYKIGGTWVDGASSMDFTLDGSGRLTYNGKSGVTFLFNGVSDLSVSFGGSQTTYALYLNGALVPAAQTPIDFNVLNSIGNISITAFITLNQGDYIEIWCKNDNAGTVVTHNTLAITLLGDK